MTNMVAYRDTNVVYNSLNTQICASLPLNSLKKAKKQSGTDRQMDLLTNTMTYRDANVVSNSLNTVYNSLNTQIYASLPLNSLKKAKKQSGTDRPTDRQTD